MDIFQNDFTVSTEISNLANTSPFTEDQWGEMFDDCEIFTNASLQIMKQFIEYGGKASIPQLSAKFDHEPKFIFDEINNLTWRLVNRDNGPETTERWRKDYWQLLFSNASELDPSKVQFRELHLQESLLSALEKEDLPNVLKEKANLEKRYWWLVANPKDWSIDDWQEGTIHPYSLYSDSGKKRAHFEEAKAGDMVIGHRTMSGTKKPCVVALSKISTSLYDDFLFFEKSETLSSPISFNDIKTDEVLSKISYIIYIDEKGKATVKPQSLSKLTMEQYNKLMEMIREKNPEKYYSTDFLREVFMTAQDHDKLCSLLERKKNVILQGVPGVGKTYAAERLAWSIMGEKDKSRIEFVQFHQNYSYEDFVMGYKPKEDGFELRDGIFKSFCDKARKDPERKYFFIIDEINRGNLSKIFGELLMAIENDHRGEPVILAYNQEPFWVPENVYIIGMMNTADRSLALIDYALRRRFSFFEMETAFGSDGFKAYQESVSNEKLDKLIVKIEALNKEITEDHSLGRGFRIGHSYFCNLTKCTNACLHSIVDYEILPLLEEYWFDDEKKYQAWKEQLLGIFK